MKLRSNLMSGLLFAALLFAPLTAFSNAAPVGDSQAKVMEMSSAGYYYGRGGYGRGYRFGGYYGRPYGYWGYRYGGYPSWGGFGGGCCGFGGCGSCWW